MTCARVATSSRMSSLINVDLPAPDGPTRNTKSPSGTTRSTSRRATLPLGYSIVTSRMTRTARSRREDLGAASEGVDGGSAPVGGASVRVTFGSAVVGDDRRMTVGVPVYSVRGGAEGATSVEATTPPWRSPPRAAIGPSQQPGRDRQVSREVGGGRSQHRSSGNGSRRRPERSAGTSARSAVPGIHVMKAPRGSTAASRWPSTGSSSASSRTRTGPTRPLALL